MDEFVKFFLEVSLVLLIYITIIFLYSSWKKHKIYKESIASLSKIQNSLDINSIVIFSGGIKGKVVKFDDIWVTVEVGNQIQLKILKSSIVDILPAEKW